MQRPIVEALESRLGPDDPILRGVWVGYVEEETPEAHVMEAWTSEGGLYDVTSGGVTLRLTSVQIIELGRLVVHDTMESGDRERLDAAVYAVVRAAGAEAELDAAMEVIKELEKSYGPSPSLVDAERHCRVEAFKRKCGFGVGLK